MGSVMLSMAEPVTSSMAKSAANAYITMHPECGIYGVAFVNTVSDTNQAHTVLWHQIRYASEDPRTNPSAIPTGSIFIAAVTEIEPILYVDANLLNLSSDDELYITLANDVRQKLRDKGLYEEDPTPPPSPFYPTLCVKITLFDPINYRIEYEYELDMEYVATNYNIVALSAVPENCSLTGFNGYIWPIGINSNWPTDHLALYGATNLSNPDWTYITYLDAPSYDEYWPQNFHMPPIYSNLKTKFSTDDNTHMREMLKWYMSCGYKFFKIIMSEEKIK